MPTEDIYREALRRSHRLLGAYLSLWAWKHGVDAVVIQRGELLPFLGLKRMKNQRVNWLMEDVKHLFKDAWNTVDSSSGTYSTLYLSRFTIPAATKEDTLHDKDRVTNLVRSGLKAAIVKVPKEAEIVRLLATVMHGLSKFPK